MVMIDFKLADIKLKSDLRLIFAEVREKSVVGFLNYY